MAWSKVIAKQKVAVYTRGIQRLIAEEGLNNIFVLRTRKRARRVHQSAPGAQLSKPVL